MGALVPLLAVIALLLFAGPVCADVEIQTGNAPPVSIIVGGDRDYPPYEFLDKDGKPAGFNVDLTRAIAEVMGMRVEFRFGGWSEMRDALMTGKVDVLQGISYSDERAQTLAFSPPPPS